MENLARIIQEVFGIDAGIEERAQIGSFAAGTPAFTTDAEAIQALSNFKQGLFGVCVGQNSPALEDINSLYFLLTRQLAYLFQKGVPEYHATTEYYIGSIVSDGFGALYLSLTDNNIGNIVTDGINWTLLPIDGESLITASVPRSKLESTYAVSASSGLFSNSLIETWVDVPNLNVLIPSTGSPIKIGLECDPGSGSKSCIQFLDSSSADAYVLIQLVDTTGGGEFVVGEYLLSTKDSGMASPNLSAVRVPPSIVSWTVFPSLAGNKSYKVRIKNTSSDGWETEFNNVRLVAIAY